MAIALALATACGNAASSTVTEMITALRALITDIRHLIDSVGDNRLHNHYVDQKDRP